MNKTIKQIKVLKVKNLVNNETYRHIAETMCEDNIWTTDDGDRVDLFRDEIYITEKENLLMAWDNIASDETVKHIDEYNINSILTDESLDSEIKTVYFVYDESYREKLEQASVYGIDLKYHDEVEFGEDFGLVFETKEEAEKYIKKTEELPYMLLKEIEDEIQGKQMTVRELDHKMQTFTDCETPNICEFDTNHHRKGNWCTFGWGENDSVIGAYSVQFNVIEDNENFEDSVVEVLDIFIV